MDIALSIKYLLKKKKITQVEFAEMIGKTPPTIINYFNGRSKIDVETLILIAKVLEVNVCSFFDTDPDEVWREFSHQTGQGNINQQGIKNKMGADTNKVEMLQQENKHLRNEIKLKDKIIELMGK